MKYKIQELNLKTDPKDDGQSTSSDDGLGGPSGKDLPSGITFGIISTLMVHFVNISFYKSYNYIIANTPGKFAFKILIANYLLPLLFVIILNLFSRRNSLTADWIFKALTSTIVLTVILLICSVFYYFSKALAF